MSTNDQQPEETQEAIDARLLAVNAGVGDKLAGMPTFDSIEEEAAWLEENMPANPGCPIDPQERLLCEGCQ